jgi:DNA-binding LacI/PurR family transcriptional regulator
LLVSTRATKITRSDLKDSKRITLKSVAAKVGLTPGTVSAVLNDTAAARVIPAETKNRIVAAARELDYRPNFYARSLRSKRTYTIGVVAEEIGDAYGSLVISGIESYLREKEYFFFTVIHRHSMALLKRYTDMLMERGVEGFITVDTNLPHGLSLPTVAVAGHRRLTGVTNIVLDHEHAALIALEHLSELGHKRIAFMKGNPVSSDSEDRWKAICKIAKRLRIEMDPELIVQIELDDPSPQLGYPYGKELLGRTKSFTALFAYNDISAIGAIRAFQEAGLRIPQDVTVVGFDDIQSAAFNSPSLTTVRQPLGKMGEIAAETLIARIESERKYPEEIAIEPVLVIRESSGPAPKLTA